MEPASLLGGHVPATSSQPGIPGDRSAEPLRPGVSGRAKCVSNCARTGAQGTAPGAKGHLGAAVPRDARPGAGQDTEPQGPETPGRDRVPGSAVCSHPHPHPRSVAVQPGISPAGRRRRGAAGHRTRRRPRSSVPVPRSLGTCPGLWLRLGSAGPASAATVLTHWRPAESSLLMNEAREGGRRGGQATRGSSSRSLFLFPGVPRLPTHPRPGGRHPRPAP